MGDPEFIVVFQQIVGNPEFGYSTAYSCDAMRFATREKAVRHGLRTRGSDDFNIATVEGNYVTGFFWMDKPLDYDLAEVAEALGLKPPVRG